MCHTLFDVLHEFVVNPSATELLGDLNDGDSSDPSLNLNEAMAMYAYGRGL